jgi:inhibitor of KinA
MGSTLSIFPLGDSAATIELGDYINEELNQKALAIQTWILSRQIAGIKDVIVAYSSVSVFYDPVELNNRRAASDTCKEGAFECIRAWLEQAWREVAPISGENGGDDQTGDDQTRNGQAGKIHRVPVCYGSHHGPDLDWLAREKGIPADELIRLHCSRVYRVYMIGFLPGFSYLGEVDERLRIPRKQRPSLVKAGGVGIAGSQTGIYPLNSPGGWQIIGRTPLRLFDPHAELPILLKAGDYVQFFALASEEFLSLSEYPI